MGESAIHVDARRMRDPQGDLEGWWEEWDGGQKSGAQSLYLDEIYILFSTVSAEIRNLQK